MPILKRLTDDDSDNGRRDEHQPPGISPIVPGRTGRPSFSLEALRERVERQFKEETAGRDDILLELDTEERRRAMLREVADYVLTMEAITLSARDKSALIESAYRSLFTFGPLDDYANDDAVTEITIIGPREIHIRRGTGQLEPVAEAFDDRAHLAGTLERVLAGSGVSLSHAGPFLETGVMIQGRPARIGLIGPPVNPDYSLTIRLHPRQPVSLNDLHARLEMLPPQAVSLLRAILVGGHGLLIVGDAGQGKTTLAGALARSLPPTPSVTVIERAAEIWLPDFITRRIPIPPGPDMPGTDFAATLRAALDESTGWLIVDDIRGDESAAVWDALTHQNAPHYLWVFRGDTRPDRLRSALGMVIRKQHPAVEQRDIHRALAARLPFVAALRPNRGAPRLGLIAEWVLDGPADDPADSLALRPILEARDDTWALTGHRPSCALDLPDDFWPQTGRNPNA
ncbi:MAG: Flp pilus assembly complex ATPase component TadA [Lentisphaerae bacterium]|nr:Flp pilus assembly complex ATPase component TadA [Lentisphaerota bacterium]